jgi:phosphatidylserine/phosphatidylglycerophosphate/cardiolipin synthase-like enzyme
MKFRINKHAKLFLKSILFVLIFIVLSVSNKTFAQAADHVVISEILIDGIYESDAATNDEFIEIYNPTNNIIDLSGWTIDYRSATSTTFQNKFTFPSGVTIGSHKYYLFGGGGVSNKDNSGSLLLGLGNTGGGAFLRNSSGTTIDLIGWGTAATGNYEGTVAVKPAQGVSLERKANGSSTSATMGIGGADEFAGNGYDSDNNANDFVQRTVPQPQNSSSPAEPTIDNGGNGTGVVSVSPTWINSGETENITFKVAGNGTNILDSVLIIIPTSEGWYWSGSVSDISISGSGANGFSVSTLSDTIYIGSLNVTDADSLILSVSNVISPDNAGYTDFMVETAVSGGTPLPVAALPRITVLKVVPIVQVHVNDASGVPTSPYGLGATVTINGIITADFNQTRTDVYVQDATAGINLYNPTRFYNYQVGDSVTVTGTILQFRGLTEISPDPNLFFIHSHGSNVAEPMILTASDVNSTFHTDDFTEPNEGRLIRVNGVTYNASNSTITDASGTTGAYLGSLIAPAGTFDLIGILKQYKPGTNVTPPYTSDYEVVPRFQEDIIQSSNINFTSLPTEENIQPNSVDIAFKTSEPVQAIIKYGKTTTYTDSIIVLTADSIHLIELSSLWPSTVYHYKVGLKDQTSTNYTGDAIFSTASPVGSLGTMNVYFNRSVNTSVSTGENAQQVDISQKFINRINSANYSIDLALYSLSGTVGSNIASALINAKGRGVKVRVIGEKDNQSTAPWTTLKNAGIPVIDDSFDPLNYGTGLMHNKFGIFDFRDTSSFVDDWIWTGSWNATDPGNNNDAQNVIEIQDKSLANAYTMEFNEMWGSSTDVPNSSTSRFGVRKTDNTPHKFNVLDTPVELYFDPSDHTSSHIGDELNKARYSINIAMLTFTYDNLAQILINKKNEGDKVRVILDNNTDTGNEYSNLLSNGIDILLKGSSLTGLLHHKYAIIDGENVSLDQTVITGSHNWSSSAETSNNENTIFVHSNRIANLYLQEFKARYLEAGGSDQIDITDVQKEGDNIPAEFSLAQNYPNPFNPATTIKFSIPKAGMVEISIYDVLGREVKELYNDFTSAGTFTIQFNADGLASGMYIYRLKIDNFNISKKMILMK